MVVAALAVLGSVAGCGTQATTPRPAPAGGYPHILVIMEESQGYAGTLGTCNAGAPDPYWCSLASEYASMTDWSGIEQPYSLPNYPSITSGSMQGCTNNNCSPDSITSQDLGGQLTAAGIPWTAYMESMPTACDTDLTHGADPAEYVRRHDPWVYYQDDMPPNACDVRPYPGVSSMVTTLDSTSAPDFVWITPNLCDDGHDVCTTGGENSQIDAWLSATLPSVLSSSWFAADGTVIITVDNGPLTTGVGGTVPLTVISANAQGHGNVATAGNHFGVLRSIEDAYGLPLLGAAAQASNGDLSDLIG